MGSLLKPRFPAKEERGFLLSEGYHVFPFVPMVEGAPENRKTRINTRKSLQGLHKTDCREEP